MAVKIRLRRMGQKKAPFYTEDLSKRSEHMIRQKIRASLK